MTKMDILSKDIKGITGKIMIGFACVVASVVGTYFATKAQLTEIKYTIQSNKSDQRLTDSLQNRDIKELRLVRE